MMQDFLKRDLAIGDNVLMISEQSRTFKLGRVAKFTASGTRAQILTRGGYHKLQHSEQVVKVDGPDLTMYLLKK
jgi:hypothetical protein